MSKEIREGTCYQSGISSSSVTEDVIEEIPAPKASPFSEPLTVPAAVKPVFFDLESTGLGNTFTNIFNDKLHIDMYIKCCIKTIVSV